MVATRRREVHTVSESYQLKKTLLMAVAIGTVAVPLFVSAAIKQGEDNRSSLFHTIDSAQAVQTPASLYQRIKEQSRKICGSTDLVRTGSIERVMGNEACYQGTLEAAVERLDDPQVSDLYQREVSQL